MGAKLTGTRKQFRYTIVSGHVLYSCVYLLTNLDGRFLPILFTVSSLN